MQKTLLLSSALLLSACGADVSRSTLLKNPLYAEVYWGDMAKRLADIEISKDLPDNKALLEDPSLVSALNAAKEEAIAEAQDASAIVREGVTADFVPVSEEPQGRVLVLGDALYTAPYFNTPPGPSLHLFLSELVDPRGGDFLATNPLDLGELEQPYGSASYNIPGDASVYATVVLFDTELRRMYGFAQIQRY